jgi:hypothetical protein
MFCSWCRLDATGLVRWRYGLLLNLLGVFVVCVSKNGDMSTLLLWRWLLSTFTLQRPQWTTVGWRRRTQHLPRRMSRHYRLRNFLMGTLSSTFQTLMIPNVIPTSNHDATHQSFFVISVVLGKLTASVA